MPDLPTEVYAVPAVAMLVILIFALFVFWRRL